MKGLKTKSFLASIGLIIIMLSAIMVVLMQHESKAELETIYATDSNGFTWICRKGENELYDLSYWSGPYNYPDNTITIPETINYEGTDYTVRSIGYGSGWIPGATSMSGYYYYIVVPNNNQVKKVVLPNTLTTINKCAFRNNSNMTTITIPGSVKQIGDRAFENCTSLSSLTLEEGVTGIEGYNNFNNTALTSITIPGSLKEVPAFYASNRLEKIICLEGVETCGPYGLPALKEVVLSHSVTRFSAGSCDALQKVTIGDGVTVDALQNSVLYRGPTSLTEILVAEGSTKYSSIDGVLYSLDGETLLAWPTGKQATNLEIPSGIKKIGDGAFRYARAISGRITFNEELESIGNYAFYENTGIGGELRYNNNLKNIGDYAFYNCRNFNGTFEFPESLMSIGSSAFYGCTGFTGDLIIPDNIISIGSGAFNSCTGLNGGVLNTGKGLTRVNSNTFNNINFSRVTLGENVTAVKERAFSNLTEIYAESPKGSIAFAEKFCTPNIPIVHYSDCTHRLTVNVAEGVKIINTTDNKEVVTGNYDCETTFSYNVQVDENTNYQNLKIVIINNDDVENAQILDIDTNTEYTFEPITRDRKIFIQPISSGLDLTLRTFITEVNGREPIKSRVPILKYGTTIDYRHTKYPVRVDKGDNVTYTIRVYNEGKNNGKANEITAYVPNGITVNIDDETNTRYGWTQAENGVYKTTYLSSKILDGNIGSGVLAYEDVKLSVTISEDSLESDLYKMIFAEISQETGIASEGDNDSTVNNVVVSENYRLDDIINSNAYSYIRGQEDDDDFDTVVLNAKIRVEYNLRIEKADKDTGELIKGAKFELRSFETNDLIIKDESENEVLKTYLDGELISTAISDENGIVDFGNITSYNEGENNFYIIETEAADEYLLDAEKQIKVKVVKKIVDEKLGTYQVSVYSEVSSYDIDTSNYKFIPITNAEELSKIGSGETVTVNGKDYEFRADKNYQLQNDIDLAGINWTPIKDEYAGIFDGNNHTIKNLTITSSEPMKVSEVGLFGSFTGIIRNLTMENPYIDINGFDNEAVTYSGYTGVGSIAGVMHRGYIFNCKTTITENATAGIFAQVDNIGGLFGHTTPQGLVTLNNCENNVSVGLKDDVATGDSVSNVGGLIGCSLGSLEITNSINNGRILARTYNAGGLVGFSQSDEYQDLFVTVQYEDRIKLLVQNEAVKGQYNLILENRRADTNELIPGSVYEIDKGNNDKQIELLKTGNLKLFDKVIEYAGKDIYFLSEEESAEGYSSLDRIVRVDVERYWDDEVREYKVRAEAALISKEEYQSFTGSQETKESTSKTDEFIDKDVVFTDTDLVTANWNTRKTVINGCTNNAEVKSDFMNAAGILGTSYGTVAINNCTNNAEIKSGVKAAGIISELRTVNAREFDAVNARNYYIKANNNTDLAMIDNCTNNGSILVDSIDVCGSVGGIIAETRGFAKVSSVTNNGEVKSTRGYQQAGGILGKAYGEISIKDSINKAAVSSIFDKDTDTGNGWNLSGTPYAGGILASLDVNENKQEVINYENTKAIIENCENYGNVKATTVVGGIMANAAGKEVEIKKCTVKSLNEDEKLSIVSQDAQNRAGILAASCCKINRFEDNKVERIKINTEEEEKITNIQYGAAAGIFATLDPNFYAESSTSSDRRLEILSISNCSVKDSELITKNQEVAGVFGKVYDWGNSSILEVEIKDCTVENSNIYHEIKGYTSYMGAAGIALLINAKEITMENCKLKDSVVKEAMENEEIIGAASNVAGVLGKTWYGDSIKILNCDVANSEVTGLTGSNTAGGIGGVIGNIHQSNAIINIEDCDIENSKVRTHYNNIGGLLGSISNSGRQATIKNCNVLETSVTRAATEADGHNYDEVGGLAGWICCPVEIDNCKVIGKDIDRDDSNQSGERTIVSSNTGCVGGLVGSLYLSGTYSIKNSQVKNIDVYNNVHTAFYADLGGIVGYGSYSGNGLIENTQIENCNVIGTETKNVGGIMGDFGESGGGTLNLKECDVINCDVVNKATLESSPDFSSTYGNAGGLTGYVGGTLVTEECNVKNSTIKCGHHSAAAGAGSVYRIQAKDCTVTDTEVLDGWVNDNEEIAATTGYGAASYRVFAGFVGTTYYAALEDITVENLNCEGKYGLAGGIGGHIGTLDKATNCEVTGATLKIKKSINNSSGSTGGLIGNVNNINGEISNNKVKSTNITTTNHNVGGMFGQCVAGGTITDCEVNKVTITHQNQGLVTEQESSDTVVGGIAGMIAGYSNVSTTIKDSKVIDCEFIGENPEDITLHMGGAVGFSKYSLTLDNVDVSDTMNNKTKGMTGGLVGLMNNIDNTYVLTITNSSVTDSSITGKGHAAGIVGVAGAGEISETEVKDTTITAERTAGGIAAIHEGTFTNCTVDGATITANTEHAGGIAGCTKGTITGCLVKDSTIEIKAATHTEVDATTNVEEIHTNCVGGIVGAGKDNAPTITSTTVENNTLNKVNASISGKYIGAPDSINNALIEGED